MIRNDFDDSLSSPRYDAPKIENDEVKNKFETKNEVNKTSLNRDDTVKFNVTTASPTNKLYRIIQLGSPRTGSTFQFQLLCSIVQMKNPPDAPPAICRFQPLTKLEHVQILQNSIKSGIPFVFKTHGKTSKALIKTARDK